MVGISASGARQPASCRLDEGEHQRADGDHGRGHGRAHGEPVDRLLRRPGQHPRPLQEPGGPQPPARAAVHEGRAVGDHRGAEGPREGEPAAHRHQHRRRRRGPGQEGEDDGAAEPPPAADLHRLQDRVRPRDQGEAHQDRDGTQPDEQVGDGAGRRELRPSWVGQLEPPPDLAAQGAQPAGIGPLLGPRHRRAAQGRQTRQRRGEGVGAEHGQRHVDHGPGVVCASRARPGARRRPRPGPRPTPR